MADVTSTSDPDGDNVVNYDWNSKDNHCSLNMSFDTTSLCGVTLTHQIMESSMVPNI